MLFAVLRRAVWCSAPRRHSSKKPECRNLLNSFVTRRGSLLQIPFRMAIGPFVIPEGGAHVLQGPVKLASNNMQMLLAAAEAGAGIAYGPSFVFGEAIASGRLKSLLTDYQTTELTIYAVFPTRRYIPARLRSFIDHLSTSMGEFRLGIPS